MSGEKLLIESLEDLNKIPSSFIPPRDLYISHCTIHIPQFLEERIKKYLMEKELEIQTTSKKIDVEIIERRLAVIAHNTWKYLITRETNTFIGLKKISNTELKSSGSLTVDNVYEHDLCVLVFTLEYLIKIIHTDAFFKQFKINVGWQFYIPPYHSSKLTKNESVSLSLKYLNGITPTGEHIFSLEENKGEVFDLNLECII